MANNLFNLNVKKNFSQSLIFYVFYLLVGLVLSVVLANLITIFYTNGDELYLSSIIAALYSIVLFFIIYLKKKSNSLLFLIIGLTLGIMTIYFGLIVSMIFIALLTTVPDRSNIIADNIAVVSNNLCGSCNSCKEVHDEDNN